MERVLHLVVIGLDEVARESLPPSFTQRMVSLKESFEKACAKLDENSSLQAFMNYVIKRINAPAP